MGSDGASAAMQNLFNATPLEIDADSIVIVGHRESRDAVFEALVASETVGGAQPSLHLVGDALAPGAIVHAVHSGHAFARGLVDEETIYLRDEPIVPAEPARVFPR